MKKFKSIMQAIKNTNLTGETSLVINEAEFNLSGCEFICSIVNSDGVSRFAIYNAESKTNKNYF